MPFFVDRDEKRFSGFVLFFFFLDPYETEGVFGGALGK